MLDGWYCRTIGIKNEHEEDLIRDKDVTNYEARYRTLKKKLKFLIYENESFQEALRSTQRNLLKVNRDKSFLLDRLLHYEKAVVSFSGSDDTDSTCDESLEFHTAKRSKLDSSNMSELTTHASSSSKKHHSEKKKKSSSSKHEKTVTSKPYPIQNQQCTNISNAAVSEGHMTPEEVERHLESRQTYLELVPEKAPPTVPTEMFSNDMLMDPME